MSRLAFITASAAALLALTAPLPVRAAPKAEHVYGPEPDWAEYRRLAEAAIAARLIDPESARFTWLTGMHKGGIRAFLSGKVEGWAACGTVNARNRLGGYTGATVFMVAIDNGRVLGTAMDTRAGGMYESACAKALDTGLYPPPPPETPAYTAAQGRAPVSADAPPSPVTTASGLMLRAMPEGAYVTAVTPASPAAAAGMKPGMVVASVNAVPLAGMGEAMIKVVDAAGSGATLAIIGGATIRLGGGK